MAAILVTKAPFTLVVPTESLVRRFVCMCKIILVSEGLIVSRVGRRNVGLLLLEERHG